MADAKARLTSLFNGNTGQTSQGNDPLRYNAPKEPSRGAQSQPQAAQQQATSTQAPAPNNAVVFHTTVSLYKYEGGKYAQQGSGSSMLVGCVLVGSEVTYSVLFYGADKAALCEVPLKAWKPIVQPKNYMNFYDERGMNWSVKFPTEDALAEFMRQAFLVKIHIEIWSPQRTLDANSLLLQDIGASAIKSKNEDDTALAPVAAGNRVAVEFKCWRVVGNAKAPPNDIVAKYPPFEKTSDGELRKFRLDDGSERIKALDEGVLGMKRGGRRMVLAPPGKTNGSDWYLIDVTLVQTKRGGSMRRASEPSTGAAAAAAAASPAEALAPRESRKSRRETTTNAGGRNGDIVRMEEEKSKDDAEVRERMRQLEREVEMHRAFAGGVDPRHAGMGPTGGFAPQPQTAYSFGGSSGGGYSPFSSMFSPQQPQQGTMMAMGRVDGMIMELHTKVDYLIRNASSASSSSSYGGPVGVTDVQSVLRGVERLAGENERLLLQINSQNQQYVSYEKRCEELLKHNQRLQEEKRLADEKYQSMASLQLNYNAEISSLTSTRDAAITQANRLHGEYQQLLTAFYQKQQVSSENEEQRNALEFERQTRARLEKDLQRETQARSIVEQELTLLKRQLDVFTKMKESELQNLRQELEKQLHAVRANQHSEVEDRIKQLTADYQQQEKRLQQEWSAQAERQAAQYQAQIDSLEKQFAEEANAKAQMHTELQSAWAQVRELEEKATTHATEAVNDAAAVGLADEEKRIYNVQIELLQQQVKELEAEKFARVQQDIATGQLGSPSSSPRGHKKSEFVDDGDATAATLQAEQLMAAAKAKEEAADRTLALAQEIKREAESTMASSNGDSGSQGQEVQKNTISLFKDAINKIFYRFEDVFEDEAYASASLEGKQVLSVIRKVLKQSTKEVIKGLQEEEAVPAASAPAPLTASDAAAPVPAPAPTTTPVPAGSEQEEPTKFSLAVPLAFGVAAAAVGAGAVAEEGNESDASNDEPPPPPSREEEEPVAAQTQPQVQVAFPEEAPPAMLSPVKEELTMAGGVDDDDDEDEEVDVVNEDLLFGAASADGATGTSIYPLATGVSRLADDSEESEDDFED